jgi:ADP-heptose:LPS heptosyltransferase
MRILVMQTTRMGDVLQTSPLVRALRRKHPDAHIGLMVRGMGKAIAERNPDVDEVLMYEEDEMFVESRAQDSDRLLRAYRCAEGQIERLKAGRFDLAYNCTHSIASAMLLKLAEIPHVVGAHLSGDWQFVLRGRWIAYFFTSVFHREYNDLNLCDITQRFVTEASPCHELVFDVTEPDRVFVRDLLARHSVETDDFLVCFQLGASEDSKRWSEVHFASLARLLVQRRKARFFLVGVKEEEPFGKAFEEQAPGLGIPLYGKTNIAQLAALLERANLLVTNDTGTMHLAAAVNCPIVLVSVGYVHFRETGPYGVGHSAIEWRRAHLGRADGVPGGLNERALIRPEQVLRAAELTLASPAALPVEQIEVEPQLAEVDLYMTRFAPDGCLEWYPVLRRPLTERDLLRIAYRAMWLEHLEAHGNPGLEAASVTAMLRYYSSVEDEALRQWRGEIAAVFRQLADLASQGIEQSETLLRYLKQNQGARKAQPIVQNLMQLDEEMRIFGEVHNVCKPLILISRYERDNLEGADPLLLAETTLQIYRDCFARATLMTRKVETVAEQAGGVQG